MINCMQIKFVDRKTKEIKIEKPPSDKLIRFVYGNYFVKMALLPVVKRKLLTSLYARKMKKDKSKKRILKFVSQFNVDMSESVRNIDDFSSFNDFFCRKLKPEARPIADAFVSPGDGKILAFEDVDSVNQFFVKGRKFTLKEFLANDELAEKYSHSSMFILRLAPNDYHRYHFPYDGVPTASTKIKGAYLSVSPYALASNFVKVFCENKREYCELKTKDKGDILIAPIGAAMVGSIVNTYKSSEKICRGDEMGYFEFGGSTIVMLVDQTKIKIDQDLLENTKNKLETTVKMGEQIAQ